MPESREHWESLARQHNVPLTQLFSDCSALPSGSKFTMEHYLPLRILVVDERSYLKPKRKKFREQYLGGESRRKVTTAIKANKSLQAVGKFLTKSERIKEHWNAKHYREVGPFGNGLEKLWQIASWKSQPSIESEDSDEDTTNLRLFASLPSPRPVPVSSLRLNAALQSLSINRSPHTPPPRGRPIRNQGQAVYTWDDESEFGESPGTEMSSAPGTDKRQAVLDFEKTTLVLSDEQVVNICLENLLMALSNVMGFYGRLVSERRAFVVPKDKTTNLYQACVDGLVMAPNREDVIAFIEVKRRLRSANDSVYRQIGAQMAAFIYNHDHQIHKDRYVIFLRWELLFL